MCLQDVPGISRLLDFECHRAVLSRFRLSMCSRKVEAHCPLQGDYQDVRSLVRGNPDPTERRRRIQKRQTRSKVDDKRLQQKTSNGADLTAAEEKSSCLVQCHNRRLLESIAHWFLFTAGILCAPQTGSRRERCPGHEIDLSHLRLLAVERPRQISSGHEGVFRFQTLGTK